MYVDQQQLDRMTVAMLLFAIADAQEAMENLIDHDPAAVTKYARQIEAYTLEILRRKGAK
jgi:hypothetical protein